MATTVQDIVKVRMGMTTLAGGKLLEDKEKADREFKEEIAFLQSCFLESPEKAASMTKLRLAKEINPDILKKYDVLSQIEPNQMYRPV